MQFRKTALSIEPVTKLGGCMIEEEIPLEWLDETTMSTAPNVNEPPNVNHVKKLGGWLRKRFLKNG